jgi:hypothetical protein
MYASSAIPGAEIISSLSTSLSTTGSGQVDEEEEDEL